MRVAIKDGDVVLADVGGAYQTLRSAGFRWVKADQTLRAPVTAELLTWLCDHYGMPEFVRAERAKLLRRRAAIEAERSNPMPTPITDYHVNANLYAHQIRGVNMALLTFGIDAG